MSSNSNNNIPHSKLDQYEFRVSSLVLDYDKKVEEGEQAIKIWCYLKLEWQDTELRWNEEFKIDLKF